MKAALLILFAVLCIWVTSATSITNIPLANLTVNFTGAAGPGTNYLNPTAYLRLDETGNPDVMIDVIGGHNFTNSSSGAIYVTGILTNAIQLERPNSDDFISQDPPSIYEFGTNDFTCRLWLRPHSTNSNNGLFMYNEGFPNGWDGMLTNVSGGQSFVQVRAYDADDHFFLSTNAISGDAWHRVIFWHREGVEVGIKIDDLTSETFSFTNAMGTVGVPLEWYVTGTGNRIDYDEIAYWKGYIPTEDEWTYDWNSGLGRTMPLQ